MTAQRKTFPNFFYSEKQLKIAIEKIKATEAVSLHIDTTGNIVKKLDGKEVFLISSIFRGLLNILRNVFRKR